MDFRVIARLAPQVLLLTLPLPFVWAANGVPWNAIVWFAALLWMVIIVRQGAPATTRFSIMLAVLVSGIYFDVLPAGRLWSYLSAGLTIFFIWGAYREQSDREVRSRPGPAAEAEREV